LCGAKQFIDIAAVHVALLFVSSEHARPLLFDLLGYPTSHHAFAIHLMANVFGAGVK
jgi:hypothetical protein